MQVSGESLLDFQTFDAEYVRKLTAGDPATEAHFSSYFDRFLSLKLRARRLSPSLADDVRQETLFRVLKVLRQGAGVSNPERFGAFVSSVCNNVVLELTRKSGREEQTGEEPIQVPDRAMDVSTALISEERKRIVADVLSQLGSKDQEILKLIFFEEADRREISDRLQVEPEYLRVLLHRAKSKFQAAYVRKVGRISHVMMLICNVAALRVTT
jgi:RNA polymerase sigma-70 factor, ECF subfamily